MNVTKLVVHHSASARKTTKKSDIEGWHKAEGFSEIGYHKVVEGNGTKKEGRSESKMGAHAAGANSGSLGVCVCGNFETEQPAAIQITALVEILSKWCQDHDLDETKIYGHCNVPGGTTTTDCPGKNLKSKLPTIRQRVKEELAEK